MQCAIGLVAPGHDLALRGTTPPGRPRERLGRWGERTAGRAAMPQRGALSRAQRAASRARRGASGRAEDGHRRACRTPDHEGAREHAQERDALESPLAREADRNEPERRESHSASVRAAAAPGGADFPWMPAAANHPLSRRCACRIEIRPSPARDSGPSTRPATNRLSFFTSPAGITTLRPVVLRGAADLAVLEVEVGHVEGERGTDSHPSSEKQLDQHPVAFRLDALRLREHVEQPLPFVVTQRPGRRWRAPSSAKQPRRVRGDQPALVQVRRETPDRGAHRVE
jgi:hypothetical protein